MSCIQNIGFILCDFAVIVYMTVWIAIVGLMRKVVATYGYSLHDCMDCNTTTVGMLTQAGLL